MDAYIPKYAGKRVENKKATNFIKLNRPQVLSSQILDATNSIQYLNTTTQHVINTWQGNTITYYR
jgi:hypothetical protein